MLGFEPSTFVSILDVLTTTPIVHNNNKLMLKLPHKDNKQFSVMNIFSIQMVNSSILLPGCP